MGDDAAPQQADAFNFVQGWSLWWPQRYEERGTLRVSAVDAGAGVVTVAHDPTPPTSKFKGWARLTEAGRFRVRMHVAMFKVHPEHDIFAEPGFTEPGLCCVEPMDREAFIRLDCRTCGEVIRVDPKIAADRDGCVGYLMTGLVFEPEGAR